MKARIFRGATVDNEFLTELPEDILKEKNFNKVPVIVGVTNHEFGWLLPFVRTSPLLLTFIIPFESVF